MMKSPTSLIRFRNAVGVMLALSAIFAVVISTISLTSDEASAQAQTPEEMAIEARAIAWWNALKGDGPTQPARANVLLGADDDGTRVLGDPTRTNIDPEATPTAGIAYESEEIAQLDYDHASQTEANQQTIRELVDGTGDGDLYAVGDHLTKTVDALMGFQSVEVWWNHMDCEEMRTVVGVDNALDTTDDDDTNEGPFCAMFGGLSSDNQAIVNKVGEAILGLGEDAASPTRGRDAAWWDKLTNEERVDALYGTGASDAIDTDSDSTTEVDESNDDATERAQADYADLDAGTKALVTDRWQWIYNTGVRGNDDGLDGVIYWWNSIGCAEMRIAVGVDNGASATEPDASAFCAPWDLAGNQLTQVQQAKILELGQAILGISPAAPDVAKWWNTLSKDQMVYVVYGNPPMRTTYQVPDPDDLNETVDSNAVTDDDKAVFQKMYDDLAGGIEVDAATTDLSTHLPQRITDMLSRNGFDVDDASTNDNGTPDDNTDDTFYYSAKGIVHALANEIFDPPMGIMDPYGGEGADGALTDDVIEVDNEFDWPYRADNGPATVADWWETTDCRVMRIAVGQDNDYLDPAVMANANADPPVVGMDAETSIYCGHFPGSPNAMPDDPLTTDEDENNILSEAAQARVEVVGRALLGLGADAGRPEFNDEATGTPTISGVAQVGSLLMSSPANIDDDDGVGEYSYQWLRDGELIKGATKSSYELQPADVGSAISVRYSFTDDERQYEMRVSNATSTIAGSPGAISRIEPGIRGITVSGGDTVTLSVNIYGLQNAKDNGIGGTFTWDENGDEIDDESGRTLDYEASSSPGKYLITASLSGADCQPEVEADRATACSAEFDVTVRRPVGRRS